MLHDPLVTRIELTRSPPLHRRGTLGGDEAVATEHYSLA